MSGLGGWRVEDECLARVREGVRVTRMCGGGGGLLDKLMSA